MTNRILVIDDDGTRLNWFQSVLGPLYAVDWAKRGIAAMQLFRAKRFDLVFFDHDLGTDSVTGSQIAKDILASPASFFKPRRVWVHAGKMLKENSDIALQFSDAGVPVFMQSFDTIVKDRKLFLDEVAKLLTMATPVAE